MTFERNLERWASGDMSADELSSAHPGEDIEGVMALHERMSTIATDPVQLDEAALQRFLAKLPDRARPRRRYRSVLLAAAAVMLMGSMAVAVPGVQHGVTAVTHGVGRLLGITAPPPAQPAPSVGSVPSTTSPGRATPGHRGGSGGAAGPSHHSTGGHGGDGTDGDERGGPATAGGDDQGQDQQGDAGSAGQDHEGSGSSDSSSGSGSASDEQGDGSGGDTQTGSSGGDTDGQS